MVWSTKFVSVDRMGRAPLDILDIGFSCVRSSILDKMDRKDFWKKMEGDTAKVGEQYFLKEL